MDSEECNRLIATHFIAKIIPLIILGIIIYGCWVFTRILCVDWLINPPHQNDPRYPEPRPATAIGLIVLYYIVLAPFILSYAILFIKVVWNHDFVQYGPDYESNKVKSSSAVYPAGRDLRRANKSSTPSTAVSDSNTVREKENFLGLEYGTEKNSHSATAYPRDPAGREAFYMKDVYLCLDDGRPPWCSICCQFKTDRTHHCKEVNRCVRKMDHFCPWVGGVVGESSFKQFMQFLVYALLYVIVNFAIFVAYTVERHKRLGTYTVHYIIGIGITSFLGIFLAAMIFGSAHNVLMNLTTIESINRKQRNHTLAIIVPRTSKFATKPRGPTDPKIISTVTFPSATDPQFGPDSVLVPHGETRTFVVVKTDKGESLFDLGSAAANWKELMGYHIYEWFLPWTRSPCENHSHPEGAYRIGPAVARLKKKYGLEPGYAPAPVAAVTSAPTLAPTAAADSTLDDNSPVPPEESETGLSDLLIDDENTNEALGSSVASRPHIPMSTRTQDTAVQGRSRSQSQSRSHRHNESRTHSRAASNRPSHRSRHGNSTESVLVPADLNAEGPFSNGVASNPNRRPRTLSRSRKRITNERSSSRSRSRSRDWVQADFPQYLSQSSPTLPAPQLIN